MQIEYYDAAAHFSSDVKRIFHHGILTHTNLNCLVVGLLIPYKSSKVLYLCCSSILFYLEYSPIQS